MYVYIETTYKIPCHFNKMEKKKNLPNYGTQKKPKEQNSLESKEQQWGLQAS